MYETDYRTLFMLTAVGAVMLVPAGLGALIDHERRERGSDQLDQPG